MEYKIEDEMVELGLKAAKEGGNYALSMSDEINVESKKDGTSVTEADKQVEDEVIDRLTEGSDYPVWGEESGSKPNSESYWVVDPIDGTRNYIDGLPMYSTSVGLVLSGDLEVSAVSVPRLDEVYYAKQGEGAYRNDQKISVSSSIGAEGIMSCPTGYRADMGFEVCRNAFGGWVRKLTASVYSTLTVASGSNHACVASYLYPWDIAGPALIVKEAGGKIESLKNGSSSWESMMYGGALIWNGDENIRERLFQTVKEEDIKRLSKMPNRYSKSNQ